MEDNHGLFGFESSDPSKVAEHEQTADKENEDRDERPTNPVLNAGHSRAFRSVQQQQQVYSNCKITLVTN